MNIEYQETARSGDQTSQRNLPLLRHISHPRHANQRACGG